MGNSNKRSMDLGALLDTFNWCDKWQFSADLFHTYGLAPLQDIRLQNLTDLEFDPSRSLKVMCDDVIGLSLYAFLLMFDSNLWPNSAPQNLRPQNLSDLELTF